MKIELLFFGITADIAGEKSLPIEIDKDYSVKNLRTKLSSDFPKLNDYKNYALAINMEYSNEDIILKEGDVVALIPPVSGG